MSRDSVYAMFRILILLLLVAGGFAGGFYSGMKYHQHEITQNPEKFLQLYKKDLAESARENVKKLKEALRKSLE